MTGLAIRNLKVFFKDKAAVFFSLLSVFIVIGLYALFLGDIWVSGLEGIPDARYLMDSWIVAGILAITSVTTTMGSFGVMVDDKVRKVDKDFRSSPLKNSSITLGYIASAIIIGIIMSIVALVISEIYIVSNGGELLGIETLLKVVGLIILTTVANSSMVLFLVSFFRSASAFTTASIIIGTLIGFLTGIYLPIGKLPDGVQWAIKCFPVSHGAALFRQVIMDAPMSSSFEGAPTEAIADFEAELGVKYSFGDYIASPQFSVAVLIITAIVFFMLAMLNMSRKKS